MRAASADGDTRRRAARFSRVRGLLLGLALGDALATEPGASYPRPSRRSSRVSPRGPHTHVGQRRSQGDRAATPPIVWNAYRRWATIQGIDLGPGAHPLDGWLHEVPALSERRGNAPAVVAALTAANGPTTVPAPPTSRGHHALTRLLPAARIPWLDDQQVRELASATHGDEATIDAAALGVAVARAALAASSMFDLVELVGRSRLPDTALDATVALERLGRSHSAWSALRGGVAVAVRCVDGSPAAVRAALHSVRDAAVPAAIGPVAGALIGAVYGVEALPVDLISRLELGWVVDTLARDLVSQDLDHPDAFGYTAAPNPHWWSRYPGW